MNSTKPKNKFFINLAVTLGSVIVTLIFTEIILHIFLVKPSNEIPDKILGVKFRSNYLEYDNNGFRNSKVPDKAEIVAIGDSLTYGYNATLNKSWPEQLENQIGESVYQMACGSYGPAQYSYLINQSLIYNPKLVIIGLYLGNDMLDVYNLVYSNEYWEFFRSADAIQSEKFSTLDNSVKEMISSGYDKNSFSYKIKSTKDWFWSKSMIYQLVGNSTRALREKIGWAKSTEEKVNLTNELLAQDNSVGFSYEEGNISTVLSPSYRYETVDLANPKTQEGWLLTQKLFNFEKENLDSKGIEMIITILPTKELVYGVYMENNNGQISESFKNILNKEKELYQNILNYCEARNIYCIEVLDELVKKLENDIAIYPTTLNGHPTEAGYQVIATAIKDFLVNNQLVNNNEK